MRGTSRTGPLPDYIGSYSNNFELLDLSSNEFGSEIPASYGTLKGLQYLLLNNNADITGTIPSTFSNLESLRGLFVDGTGLTGDLDIVCNLPAFQVVAGQEGIFADCDGPNIQCNCDCTCYDGSVGGEGSQTSLANLDATWENDFRRSEIVDKYVFLNDTGVFNDNIANPLDPPTDETP